MSEPIPPGSPPARHVLRCTFSGRGGEFFRIWIVNLSLSLLTLGLYSAWAKVRTQRYFHGCTWVGGANFEYLAEPLHILRARLLAVAVLLVYLVVTTALPFTEPLFLFAFALGLPWVIQRSLRFRARMTAHRNLQFRFHGGYGGAWLAYLLWPLLALLTLGLAWPAADRARTRYRLGQLAYGRSRLCFDGGLAAWYRLYLPVLLAGLLLLPGGGWLGWHQGQGLAAGYSDAELIELFAGSDAAPAAAADGEPAPDLDVELLRQLIAVTAAWLGAVLGLLVLLLLSRPYLEAYRYNLAWGSTTLGGHGFRGDLRARDLLWIHASNALAILFSLGLLIPWARVRLARYKVQGLSLLVQGSLTDFLADQGQGPGAAGEELGEMFGVDLGL